MDSISKKTETQIEYLLFLSKHSDQDNFFQINSLLSNSLYRISNFIRAKDLKWVNFSEISQIEKIVILFLSRGDYRM